MAIYRYVKAQPNSGTKPKIFLRFLPYVSLISGLILILSVAFPIASHELLLASKMQAKVVTPLSDNGIAEAKGYINSMPNGGNSAVLSAQNSQPEFGEEIDYTVIGNWFPTASVPRVKPSKITSYSISIPKLKIKDAVVAIGGDKIRNSLIQYPGTALPGEYGNTVIFGHSVLPIFYNPKSYETIFSTLPTLDKGDKISIYFDGIEYNYEVEDYFEVKPEEVQVLEQRFNEQVLSLITCVPPGTYNKRGIIKARLKGF